MGDQGWPGSLVARKREHGGNYPTSNRGGNEFGHYADRWKPSGRCKFNIYFIFEDELTGWV